MSDKTSFYPELARDIAPPAGKLGVLLPGLGAVSTTLIAGIHLIIKGLAQPFGSLTQMQKIRLGKRSSPRFVPIKELVPLADVKDFVFGAWDIFPDNAYEAALAAGVLPPETLEKVRKELEAVVPWPGAFNVATSGTWSAKPGKTAPTRSPPGECPRRTSTPSCPPHPLDRTAPLGS